MRSIPGATTHTQSLPDGSSTRSSAIYLTTPTRSRQALRGALVAIAILLELFTVGAIGLPAQAAHQPTYSMVADGTPSVPCGGAVWPC